KRYEELIDRLAEVNEIIRLTEIVKNAGVEFKIEMDGGLKKVKDFRKILILFEEAMACMLIDQAFSETLVSKRVELLNRTNDIIAEVTSLSRTERFDVNYYAAWQSFVKGSLVIDIGIKQMEAHEYMKATQYFLKARELLSNIKDLPIGSIINERLLLARAYASDAFNIIYLLNSHASWKMIAKSTKDAELQEIANASEKNIEEWITKQYGFPPEAKITALVNEMIWPVPELPSEVNITRSSTSRQLMEKYKN
nr:hypothetical protein [Candidatus Sigynarchaeota archaeon]